MRYTGRQIAAAMALSRLSQEQVAAEAGIGRTTLNKVINGKASGRDATLQKLCAVFERGGIEFTAGEGVRMKDRTLTVHETASAYRMLLDDVYNTLKDTGGEVLIAFVDESQGMKIAGEDFLRKHLERLHKANISERLLIRDRDTTLIAPIASYHRIPTAFFSPHQLYIYGNKIAHLARLDTPKAIIINDCRFAGSMRSAFELIWASTAPAAHHHRP